MRRCSDTSAVNWIGAPALRIAGVKLCNNLSLGISKWSMGPDVPRCNPVSITDCLYAWNSTNESTMELINELVNVGA